jgi:peptidoglycan/xylan/chitin deacetylase (PgdA/CDA1 family)
MDLPTELFERQLEILSGAAPVSMRQALSRLRAADGVMDASLPIVVTFDDGTADFVDTALPLLVQHRIPSLLYVATRFIEEGREFPRGGRPSSWAGLRDALSTGLVTIGSHTHSHRLLDRVSSAEAESDLRRSVDLIGEQLGVVAEHFAYPKAVGAGELTESIVRRLFISASLGGNRANVPGRTDPFRLARTPIQASDGMHWFEAKVAGGLALEDKARRLLNRARYRRVEL